MRLVKLCFVFLFIIIVDTEAARVLAFYPCPSISHQIVFRPITLGLLKRGHHVTVITPDPIFKKGETPANLTEIDVHDVSYKIIKEKFASVITGKETDFINQVQAIIGLNSIILEEHFKLQGVQDLLKYEGNEFDLLLLEAYNTAILGLTHKFRAPAILVSSFGAFPGNYEAIGAPLYPLIYHDSFRQNLYNLTLSQKITELLNRYRVNNILNESEDRDHKTLKKIFGPDVPPIGVLKNNIDMLFLNSNPMWAGNHPVPPTVIHMGGLHQKPPKELPENLQKYLDASINGVIYFSFGTNVNPLLLPSEKIAIFDKVFSQLPYNVIWKWENNNLIVNSSNIKVFQWVPQSDILRHPNVKLFITQGGLQSTDESITAGVPLIGIPMLGDQWYNVEKYVHHKIGVRLYLEHLTEDQLKEAIVEVAEADCYRRNIARLRQLMLDQPQTPLERTMWWIEYVLRQGGAKHLRAPAANMSWSEYLELELFVFLLFGVLSSMAMVFVAIRFIVSILCKKHISLNDKLAKKITKLICLGCTIFLYYYLILPCLFVLSDIY